MKKRQCQIFACFLVMVFTIICFSSEASAYIKNGYHLGLVTLVYTPSGAFGTTTISHFNEALYQWNRYAGRTLMKRTTTTHNDTNFSSTRDQKNYVYKIGVSQNYVALNRFWADISSKVILESDINFNANMRFANSAVSGCYDVWSVFVHEAGHTAGLADLGPPYLDVIVMYGKAKTNATKRYLHSDDIAGVQAIY